MSSDQTQRAQFLKTADEINRRSLLFRLPPELLQHVFNLAYHSCQPPSLLCHALSSFVVRARWQVVKVKGYEQLVRVAIKVHVNVGVASAIRTLIIKEESYHASLRRDRDDQAALRALPLPAFFHVLSAVEKLDLRVGWTVTHAALSALRDPMVMPRLASLKLGSAFDGWQDPYDVRYWSFLAERHCVTSLDIFFADRGQVNKEVEQDPPGAVAVPLMAVSDLTFRSCRDSRLIGRFLTIFPSLTKLVVFAGDEVADCLSSFLSALSAPQKLELLDLELEDCPHEVSTSLSPFTSLTDLCVSSGCDSDIPSFHRALRQRPCLKALSFRYDGKVLASDLADLLHGKEEHPTLKHVDLDVFSALAGPSIRDHGAFWDVDSQTWTPHSYGWDIPTFEEPFSLEQAKALRKAAKRGGVRLHGEAIDAISTYETYEEEKRLVEEKWAA
ncbi:hypothetical protein JCM8097_005072 [Rhodosporidiobolus ruineniae]